MLLAFLYGVIHALGRANIAAFHAVKGRLKSTNYGLIILIGLFLSAKALLDWWPDTGREGHRVTTVYSLGHRLLFPGHEADALSRSSSELAFHPQPERLLGRQDHDSLDPGPDRLGSGIGHRRLHPYCSQPQPSHC
ncbi:hypothetical protein [Desulfonatronum sp. SC1]|uniref:hypothetical protein n=1 Tax=Desulfonatronum sp. SC1 TaxID=2109626 RepID=UPI0011B26625|nr:hypothetical protein [Desulfonatronum sp. SC1]